MLFQVPVDLLSCFKDCFKNNAMFFVFVASFCDCSARATCKLDLVFGSREVLLLWRSLRVVPALWWSHRCHHIRRMLSAATCRQLGQVYAWVHAVLRGRTSRWQTRQENGTFINWRFLVCAPSSWKDCMQLLCQFLRASVSFVCVPYA